MTAANLIAVLLIANTFLLVLMGGLTASIVLHQRHCGRFFVELNARLRRALEQSNEQ